MTNHVDPQDETSAAAFRRVLSLIDGLPQEFKPSDDTPLREAMPGGWPTIGEFRAFMGSTESPAPQMVGWQDISTAPKTGEEFIARTGPEWSSFSCSWDGEMFVHYDRDDGIIAYGPKQWMPMPGPDADPESPLLLRR